MRRCDCKPDDREPCARCAREIDEAEFAKDWPDVDGREADRAADRYERWLNGIAP